MITPLRAALTALPVGFLSLAAQAEPSAGGPGYWHHGWGGGWGHMLFGSLMMVAFWGGLIVLVVILARRFGADSHSNPPLNLQGHALQILQERFARGEIEKEDFEERKRTLSTS